MPFSVLRHPQRSRPRTRYVGAPSPCYAPVCSCALNVGLGYEQRNCERGSGGVGKRMAADGGERLGVGDLGYGRTA
jgi:hypothetical protein